MLRDSLAGIPDLDPRHSLPAAACDQYAAAAGVAHGIADQVEQNALDKLRVAVRPDRCRSHPESQAHLFCQRREIAGQAIEQGAEGKVAHLRNHLAFIQPRNVEDGVQQILQRVYRRLDMGDQYRFELGGLRARQSENEQPERMQRLSQVVTGRGQKVRLGYCGVLRRLLFAQQVTSGIRHPRP